VSVHYSRDRDFSCARLNGLKVGRHYTVVVVRQLQDGVNVIDDTLSNLIAILTRLSEPELTPAFGSANMPHADSSLVPDRHVIYDLVRCYYNLIFV